MTYKIPTIYAKSKYVDSTKFYLCDSVILKLSSWCFPEMAVFGKLNYHTKV